MTIENQYCQSLSDDMMKKLSKPIVVLGAARSGTKMLANLLKKHPDVAYLEEPNYIWKRTNGWVGHDMLPASLATPELIAQIREVFIKYMEKQGKTRFCEKTPANTLRLPFVLEVLPDAKVIHILRDGRDVAVSSRNCWLGRESKRSALEMEKGNKGVDPLTKLEKTSKRKLQELLPQDIPYYLPYFLSTIFYRLGLKKEPAIWGPRFPGIQQLVHQYSLIEMCAIQWRWSVVSSMNCIETYKNNIDYLEVKYEDICESPNTCLKRIYDFSELSSPDNFSEICQSIASQNTHKWKQKMNKDELERIMVHISRTLKELGYEV